MACSNVTIKGIVNDCAKSKGGIKAAWIAPYVDDAYTVSGGTITGFADSVSGKPFHNVYFKKNTGNFTSTATIDVANGVNYVSTEIALIFSKMETAKRLAVAAMAVADMLVIVQDANGQYWAFGKDTPVICTAGTGNTGTNATDGNNYQITLTDESDEYPMALTEGAITALKALVADEA